MSNSRLSETERVIKLLQDKQKQRNEQRAAKASQGATTQATSAPEPKPTPATSAPEPKSTLASRATPAVSIQSKAAQSSRVSDQQKITAEGKANEESAEKGQRKRKPRAPAASRTQEDSNDGSGPEIVEVPPKKKAKTASPQKDKGKGKAVARAQASPAPGPATGILGAAVPYIRKAVARAQASPAPGPATGILGDPCPIWTENPREGLSDRELVMKLMLEVQDLRTAVSSLQQELSEERASRRQFFAKEMGGLSESLIAAVQEGFKSSLSDAMNIAASSARGHGLHRDMAAMALRQEPEHEKEGTEQEKEKEKEMMKEGTGMTDEVQAPEDPAKAREREGQKEGEKEDMEKEGTAQVKDMVIASAEAMKDSELQVNDQQGMGSAGDESVQVADEMDTDKQEGAREVDPNADGHDQDSAMDTL
ncbi:hypothetical protein PYCCODRAFT_1472433 [Trametes coccinea BRFM310]|uniref:Uncharacterized protein n=1 Tax=Trametes coccinea (strain BRFM310) TaxID=1353009 RepID=A0A1Y2I9W5_TRAC3|nr:hypothetical protein PYCCODRAFT_1472433 [Trametes coccinea BRFM310]